MSSHCKLWKVSEVLLISFLIETNSWLFKEISGSQEQKCGQSLGRGIKRPNIPSLVKARGANGVMERNPLGSKTRWGTGMLGNLEKRQEMRQRREVKMGEGGLIRCKFLL